MPISFDPSYWKQCWTYQKGLDGKLPGAILAAGLGKRMDPLTVRHIPKPMFPLGGKVPIVELWMRRMVESGISDVSMNLCVLSETIRRHFGDAARFAATLHYVDEDKPSGTLGGVCKQALGRTARQVLAGEQLPTHKRRMGSTILVPSGDIVTNFSAAQLEEMYDIHRRMGAALSMVLVPVPWEKRKDFGTVVLDRPEQHSGAISGSGRISEFVEKDPNSPSNLNNASIYLIEMELLDMLDPLRTAAEADLDEPFYDFGKHVFPAMLGRLPYCSLPSDLVLWGLQYEGRWFDVGQKRDYLRVNEALLDGELDINLPFEQYPWGYLGTDVSIDFSRTEIVPPVVIGNGCVIEPETTIGPYAVIGDGWIVERGACIRHSVLWERYPTFDQNGREQEMEQRRLVDRHVIRAGVTVEESIIAGGTVQEDVRERTFDVLEDGRIESLSIDYVPSGPRA